MTARDYWDLLLSVDRRLERIERVMLRMTVDQAAFDAALVDFLADLEAGLTAIQAKLDAAGSPVDLSAELQQITDAKAKLDAQVSADTAEAPPVPSTPPAEPSTPPAAEPTP